jgi:exodeoxyribonuclease-3
VSLRILSYNIRHGGVNREKPIAAAINACEPDVVVLQEAVRPDVVERLASSCGMKAWGSVRGHSVAYLSRVEIAHHSWHKAPLAKRRYLELIVSRSRVRVFGVHLAAVHSNMMERRRAYEVRSLLAGMKQRHEEGFHVVTGDFNTGGPGEKLDLAKLPFRLRMFAYLTGGKIRWTTIQLMLDGGYTDAYREFDKTGDGFTFPTWDPHVRLDYLFVPKTFASRLIRCEIMKNLPSVREASDHFPLLSEVAEE